MGSPTRAAGTHIHLTFYKMKLVALLALATGVTSLSENDMVKHWKMTQAYGSCWGEENMKLWTVIMKQAMAKCAHQDAPELSLPPFRSAHRFVNTMHGSSNNQETKRANMVWRLMESVKESYGSNSVPYRPHNNYRDNMDNEMMMNVFMKIMSHMNNKDMHNMYHENIPKSFDNMRTGSYRQNSPMARMSQIVDMFTRSRSKRDEAAVAAAGDSIGDRLVEKLNEKKHVMQEEIGNMTCVLKEMGYLDYQNDLDLQGMKKAMKHYTPTSDWFEKHYHEMLRTCYEMATNLPEKVVEQSVVKGESFGSVKMEEIKTFFKCCTKEEEKLCMNQETKRKIESNFGPLEEILEQTQLTEYQLFPLVNQLLQGQEMEFMMKY